MEKNKIKPSILLSIFKRKGGEGALTKIINDDNKLNFFNQILSLDAEELPLLCFKQDELNWLLITNNRIIDEKAGIRLSIPYSELAEVSLALQEEYKDGIMNKEDFTRFVLKDNSGRRYIIESEKGRPYQGIYQMLHYITSNNQMP